MSLPLEETGFEVLISADKIAEKVNELAKQISSDYQNKELHIICILKGTTIFLADLIRKLTIPVTYDFIACSSYGDATQSTGVVKITKDLDEDVESKHILLLEDIVDTGLTLNYLIQNFKNRRIASQAICSFLDRPARRKVNLELNYVGFVIPDVYVVGYGLDLGQQHRQYDAIYSVAKVDSVINAQISNRI